MKIFKKQKNYSFHLNEKTSFGKQFLFFVWEVFKVIVISLAIIIPVRYFLIQPFYVKGASMEPNFYNHEYLIVNEISYRFNVPERGDTVVFKYPVDPSQHFIKRVIGLPGEKIKINSGRIYIINENHPEGAILKEDYLSPSMMTLGDVNLVLAEDEYFLMGDNRIASLDSRNFGPVKRKYIVGKTLFRLTWELDRIGLVINNLEYNL